MECAGRSYGNLSATCQCQYKYISYCYISCLFAGLILGTNMLEDNLFILDIDAASHENVRFNHL